MTLTLEPQEGVQYVTERATDAPVVPVFRNRETAAEHAIRMAGVTAKVHELSGYTGPLRRKNRDALGRGA